MLDKLKQLGEAGKGFLLYILTPLAFIAGLIFFLITKNRDLEDEVMAKDGDIKLKGLQDEQKAVDSSANNDVDTYERLRDAYNANLYRSSSSVRPSGTSTEGSNQNKGPGIDPVPSNAADTDKTN